MGHEEKEGRSLRKLEGKLSPFFTLLKPPALHHAKHLQSDSRGEDWGYPLSLTESALPFFITAGVLDGKKGV